MVHYLHRQSYCQPSGRLSTSGEDRIIFSTDFSVSLHRPLRGRINIRHACPDSRVSNSESYSEMDYYKVMHESTPPISTLKTILTCSSRHGKRSTVARYTGPAPKGGM